MITSNNFKLHLNQCPETFQTFHHIGTRVPENTSTLTTLSQQSHFQLPTTTTIP